MEIRRKEKERKRIQAEEAIRLQKEQIERERLRKENELRAIQVCISYCRCSPQITIFPSQNSHRLNKINQLVNSPIGDLVLKGLTPEQIRNLEPDEIINKQV